MKNSSKRTLMLILITASTFISIWLCGTGLAESGAFTDRLRLEIPDQITVPGPSFSLSDLATLKGGLASDLEIIKKIGFGPAPQPGQVRRFTRNYLELILQQYRFSRQVELQMGEQVEVKVASLCFRADDFKEAITNLLPPLKTEITRRWVEFNNLPAEIWVSRDEWRLEAAPAGNLPELGPVLFRVTLVNQRNPSANQRVFNISGRIRATAKVYRALQNIPRHGLIKQADFESAEQELVTGHEVLGEIPSGTRTTQSIRRGDPLRADQIQPIPLVCKDEEVQVIARDGQLTIQLTGIAKADGWLGDEISLMNPTSKKLFKGRVIGEDFVEVKLK